jgi:hypothetical protein
MLWLGFRWRGTERKIALIVNKILSCGEPALGSLRSLCDRHCWWVFGAISGDRDERDEASIADHIPSKMKVLWQQGWCGGACIPEFEIPSLEFLP